MNFNRTKKRSQKKFFQSIFLWVSIFISLLLLLFSVVIYTQTSKTILENNKELNQQILNQIAFNIDQMDANVKSVCKSLYFNTSSTRMMNRVMEDDEIYDWILEFDKVTKPILSSNSAIHSIYIYNAKMDRYFSSYRYLNFDDVYFDEAIGKYSFPPILRPFIREIEDINSPTGTKKIFSYLMYEDIGENGKPEGAVVVNISADWIMQNINDLNELTAQNDSVITILDSQNNPIEMSALPLGMETATAKSIKQQLAETTVSPEFTFTEKKINGIKYGITYNHIVSTDWTVVKFQPYQKMFKYVNQQQIFILAITAVFFAVALGVGYLLSFRIYRPIGKLVQKMTAESDLNSRDEISMLNQTYDKLLSENKLYTKNQYSVDTLLHTFYLKELLVDSVNIAEASIEILRNEYAELLGQVGTYVVCVMKLDNYAAFQQQYDSKNQKLLKYGVVNITQELLSDGFIGRVVSLTNDEFAALIKVEPNRTDYRTELEKVFKHATFQLQKHLSVTLTTAISDETDTLRTITKLYRQASDYAIYRLIFGKASVITTKMVQANQTNQSVGIEPQHLKKLLDKIIARDVNETRVCLKEVIEKISSQRYNHLVNSNMILIVNVLGALFDSNKKWGKAASFNTTAMYSKFIQLETLDEVHTELLKVLEETEGTDELSAKKNDIITDTIKKMMEENYTDKELCLQQIADRMKMSAQYVGRLFKNNYEISVADYINELRVNKAKELLAQTQFTVSQIADKIGIENESQFYRLFKKAEGITPKEYALKNRIGKV